MSSTWLNSKQKRIDLWADALATLIPEVTIAPTVFPAACDNAHLQQLRKVEEGLWSSLERPGQAVCAYFE